MRTQKGITGFHATPVGTFDWQPLDWQSLPSYHACEMDYPEKGPWLILLKTMDGT